MYTILWGKSTLLLKHFRNNLLNIYSIGLNRAEHTVAEPALSTAEDGNKPRTVQIQATDKYERPADGREQRGVQGKASHDCYLKSNVPSRARRLKQNLPISLMIPERTAELQDHLSMAAMPRGGRNCPCGKTPRRT